jgi:hypothetical protein
MRTGFYHAGILVIQGWCARRTLHHMANIAVNDAHMRRIIMRPTAMH